MEARLTVEEGQSIGSQFVVRAGETKTLGQGPGVTITLQDPRLLPSHAAVRLQGSTLQVVDLGGMAGTLLNDERLQPNAPVEVQVGDALTLGRHVLRIELFDDDGRAVRAPQRAEKPGLEAAFTHIRELGCGAMGRVFAAVRVSDGRPVAVKLLHESVIPGSPDHERFVREGAICARVQSPYVVAVLERCVDAERTTIVSELVQGPSLEGFLIQRGPLPIPAALRITEDIGQALAAAAAVGIVHRDVKPANILLSPEGVAKLTDFGIAKDLDSTMRTLTVSGQGLGTMAYLPPEQVSEAKHVDARADIYSLGATLYHMLAGQPPFQPQTVQALFQIVEQQPTPVTTHRPDCPPQVAQLVHAMMDKDPFSRPPNARRLVRSLVKLRDQLYPGYSLQALFTG